MAALLMLIACGPAPNGPVERPVRIVAFGNSLTEGFGLPADATFPAKLEKALRAKGFAVEIRNAGKGGDTTAGGLTRLDRSVPEGTDGVIVELGGNDMLGGIDPNTIRQTLDEIVRRLTERRLSVLIAGMRAVSSRGPDYVGAFEPIYGDLAVKYNTLLYPFFLDGVVAFREGVADDPKLTLDGLHPNAAGIDVIVARILPTVEELVARAACHAHITTAPPQRICESP